MSTERPSLVEIAACALGLLAVAGFLASPVILWMLFDGLRRFCYEWPP